MERNQYQECFGFILNSMMLPRQFGKTTTYNACLKAVNDALAKYGKYEKLIDLIESSNMNIDSVYNLLYIHAAEIDLNDENHIEMLNKLIKEGKVKGYD